MWTAEKQVGNLEAAIKAFHIQLPGWWYSVGACHVSADASCAPDSAGKDRELLDIRLFDNGFDADLHPPATMADALISVTKKALAARRAHYDKI